MKKIVKVTAVVTVLWILSCSSSSVDYCRYDQEYLPQVSYSQRVNLSDGLKGLETMLESKNGVFSIEEGDISLISRAWLCDAAEKSIDIQYFIFSTDNVGLIALDYLLRAAERGVKIRMLVDDLMVDGDTKLLLSLNAHPNFEIKIYNPNANIGKNLPRKLFNLVKDFREFNLRMHNKTFIVDSIVAITGGRNVADEYFDYDHKYNFRDRDVLLLGKVVNEINLSFKLFWESDLSVAVEKIVKSKLSNTEILQIYQYLHCYALDPDNFWPQVRSKIKNVPMFFENILESGKFVWCDSVAFVSDDPGKNKGKSGLKGSGICTDSLMSLIRKAESEIYIQTPYLVTTETGKQLFENAVKKGVKVKILTNSLSSTDNLEAFSGYKRDRNKLLKTGVEIYEFRPDAQIRYNIMTSALQEKLSYSPIFGHHAKSMVIDDSISVIGTFNLDPRSANLNTECVAVIYDKKIAHDLKIIMTEELRPENAWKITENFNPDSEAGLVKRIRVIIRRIIPKSIL